MPLLPKGSSYTAQIGDAPIFAGRRATAQDFGAPGLGESGLVEAGHKVTATAKAELSDMEESEARKALVASTEIRADYARRLDEAALDGSDLGKLKESMTADLAKIGEQFATKKGGDQLQLYTANSSIMFDQQANSINVQRAWSDARVQGQTFVNGASKLIQSNPAYLVEAERNVVDFLATFPNIRPDQRAELTTKLKQDLNMAAAMSAARIDPEATIKKLEGGEWNITDEQRRQGISYAEHNLNTRRAAGEREEHRVKTKQIEAADLAYDKYAQRILGGDLGKKLEADIVADPAFANPGTRNYRAQLVHMLRADAKALAADAAGKPVRTDPAVFNDLRERIDLPISDPRALRDPSAIWKEYGTRLNKTDAEDLERRQRDNRSASGQKWAAAEAEAIRNLKGALDKSTLLAIDAEGGTRVQAFTTYLRDKADKYRAEKKDPYTLLRPDSPDYVGNDIKLFQSGAQRTQSNLSRDLDKALTPKGEPARKSLKEIFNTQ